MSSKHSHYKVEAKAFNKIDPFIPTSKSYANRILILASLYKDEITIKNLPESTDVLTMMKCLKEMGLELEGNLKELTVKNSFPECEVNTKDDIHLQTGDGGTTNRFLMGLASLGHKKYYFHPTERIALRPVDQFMHELQSLDVNIKKENEAWLSITGPLRVLDDQVNVDCSKSTQFATALQMVISPAGKEVNPVDMHSSAKYFEITKSLCEEFQKGIIHFSIPVDFSSFAYPVALAACTGELMLNNYTGRDSFQADSEVISILNKMGATIQEQPGTFKVKKNKLEAVEVDCSSFPDLVPTLAFICSYASGESKLSKIEVLRHKESDRIDEVLKILSAFSVECSYDEHSDVMSIKGRDPIADSVDLETAKDHRMIMVAYLFMRMNGGGQIYHIEHINKSYPHFFESME